MMEKRILIPQIEEVGDKKEQSKNLVCLRTSGESQIIFIQSLVFPMVDTYYVTLIYILTFIKNKGIDG